MNPVRIADVRVVPVRATCGRCLSSGRIAKTTSASRRI